MDFEYMDKCHGPSSGWTEDYELRHYDLDPHGRLSILGMTRLFHEAAGKHAESLGLGSELLRKHGVGWVLGKSQVRLHRPAAWRDKIRIHTWRAGLQRNFALRDYRAMNQAGELLAESTSYWAMFDLNARRLVPIPEAVKSQYPSECERVGLDSSGRIVWSEGEAAPFRNFEARLSDIDENKHVTNTTYAAWALDSLEPSFTLEHTCVELSMVFRAEALLGDRIVAEYRPDQASGAAESTRFVHRLSSKDGERELTLATSTWSQAR